MNAQQIRSEFIKSFSERGHKRIIRAPLVLRDDPTTLFTGSGMQPLMPYLLGQAHPYGDRLVDCQPCFRAKDIESVGNNRHTCFFEMLGNWSLGDYGKEQQIRWFFEFLTEKVGLDPNKLYVTAFIGDEKNNIPRDTETAQIWQKVFTEKGVTAEIAEIGSSEDGDRRGIKLNEHIFYYDDNQNWWSRNGGINTTPIGDPCGPDSEVFYDYGQQNHNPDFGQAHPASDSGRFVEIGNQVFMEYQRLKDGSFKSLERKNIDFGGGLERISAAAIGSPDIFKISLFWPIIEKLQQVSGKDYEVNQQAIRIIADHLRGAVFLASDGVVPSNKEQGYVMRRLLRRSIRFSLDLGIGQNFLEQIVPVITEMFADEYPELKTKTDEIIEVLSKEERVFRQTLSKGLREMGKFVNDGLSGAEIFTLYDTFGFPVELSTEEAFKQNIKLSNNWREEFDAKMAQQRLRSQTAAKGAFKGGLEGESEVHKRYHTAAHLMAQALRTVLGDGISQCGANITTERLRFDFKYPEKVTSDKLQQIQDIVNNKIKENLSVSFAEYPLDEARELGAHGEFNDKYGDKVKVYKIANPDGSAYSLEICGGPHVSNTGVLGKFKIIKEESSSAGVRRIKAVLS